MIHVGTSGWQYDSWKNRFYRGVPRRRWLEHFSERFSTVEVNNSFYMLPKPESFRRWREESAEGFVVTVKASRFITHIRRLRDCREPWLRFWTNARELGPKLGPVLFQLPPNFRADVELLRSFTKLLPKSVRPAFEFRDASWQTDEVHAVLDDAGAALVLADRPGWRVADVATGGWSYVRFHQGRRTSPFYARSKLSRWADRIAGLPAEDVFVYFNNDEQGAAIRDALVLVELLRDRGQDVAPPPGERNRAAS